MELAHQYQSPPNCSIHRMSHCRSCKRYHLLTWILIDGFQSQEMIHCFLLIVLEDFQKRIRKYTNHISI